MKTKPLTTVATCVLASLPVAASHPAANQFVEVALSGHGVRDALGNPGFGDPDALGVARLEDDHGTLRWQITYQDLGGETITGLHLHGLFGNFNQVPFINFTLPADRPLPGGTISGVMTPQDDAGLLTKMFFFFSDEERFYLDLHTAGAAGFPGGAIAGDVPEPGAAGLLGIAATALWHRRKRPPANTDRHRLVDRHRVQLP